MKFTTPLVGAICLVVGLFGGLTLKSMQPDTPTPTTSNESAHPAPSHGMQGEMDAMTANLIGKTGDAFDQAFLDDMIAHHQGAIDMAKLVLQTSQRTELKQLANEIITAQTKEIQQMSAWRAAWFQ